MRKADTVAKERTAVLYGGLQYDVASTTMQGEAEKSGQYPFPLAEEDVVCGGGTFAYLPGSEEAIRKWNVSLASTIGKYVPTRGGGN